MLTVDTFFGPCVQFFPLHWLLFFVQQVHQNRCVPFRKYAQKSDCTKSAKSLFKLGEESSTPLEPNTLPFSRLSNQCATSYTVSVGKHCRISVAQQSAGRWPCFSPSSLEHGELCQLCLYPTPMVSYTAIATDPLTPDPLSSYI